MKWKVFKEEGRSRRAINRSKKRMFLDSDSFFLGGKGAARFYFYYLLLLFFIS